MAGGIKVDGVAALQAKLREMVSDDVVDKTLRSSMREAMKEALATAQGTVPEGLQAHRTYKGRLVAPGFLRRSLRIVARKPRPGKNISVQLGVVSEAYYGLAFVERGVPSRGIPARPWLVPAFERSVSQMTLVMTKALEKRIKRIAKKQGLK